MADKDKTEASSTSESAPEEATTRIESEAEEVQVDLKTALNQLVEAQTQAATHWDKLLHVQAELENVKRRYEKEILNTHKFASERLIKELLPVVDSFEAALAHSCSDLETAKKIISGIELTHKLLLNLLKKYDIKSLDPKGQPFNPNEHEAMGMQSTADQLPNTVISVMQKGYTLHDRVIRPALVMVAQAKEEIG